MADFTPIYSSTTQSNALWKNCSFPNKPEAAISQYGASLYRCAVLSSTKYLPESNNSDISTCNRAYSEAETRNRRASLAYIDSVVKGTLSQISVCVTSEPATNVYTYPRLWCVRPYGRCRSQLMSTHICSASNALFSSFWTGHRKQSPNFDPNCLVIARGVESAVQQQHCDAGILYKPYHRCDSLVRRLSGY